MTPAPLPGWRDLAALAGPVPAADDLARPWRRGGEAPFWFSRAAVGLARLVEWRAKTRPRPVLWLPDYFCNESSLAARAAGARVRFYPLGADLAIDWPACRELAKSAPPDIFVLVHFFGRPVDPAPAAVFCAEAKTILVEDAAHVALPGGPIGTAGDFVLYSPRKILAVPDGGLLLARVAASGFAEIATRIADAPPAWPWVVKRTLQKLAPAPLNRLHVRLSALTFAEDPRGSSSPPAAGMSAAAARLMAASVPRLAATVEARRLHERMLRDVLVRLPGSPLFAGEWADAAPYRFAFRAANTEIAARLYRQWRHRGIPVETWPDLAPEVLGAPEAHAAAIELRRTLLLLPVHRPLDRNRLLSV